MALRRVGNVRAPNSATALARPAPMGVRRRQIGDDLIVELAGVAVCEHASFEVGGVTYHVLAVPQPGVGGIPGEGGTGFVPLVLAAAKGAGKAVASLTGGKRGDAAAAAAAATAPLVVNADGSMIVPMPPAGFSWRQMPVAVADPVAVSGFDIANVFRKRPAGATPAGPAAPAAPALPAPTWTLPAPAPGMAWRLVDASGKPPEAPPKRDNVPLASLMRRGAEMFRKDDPDNDGLFDSAVGFDPWAYDTEGNGVNVRTGQAGPRLDFRRGQYRPGEGGR